MVFKYYFSQISLSRATVSSKTYSVVSFSAVNMVKFLKSGKVVLVLNGRFAGRKAVIVKVCLCAQCTHLF